MANRRFELFEYRQVLVRMRQGDSDRDIARGELMGRKKLAAVRRRAEQLGWLDPAQPLPDDNVIAGEFGRTPHLPSSCVSTVERFREQITAWFEADVQVLLRCYIPLDRFCVPFEVQLKMSNLKQLHAIFYRAASDREPVREWLLSLVDTERKLIGEEIRYVQMKWPIGKPRVDHLRGPIWEIRINLPNRIARVLFAVHDSKMLLLHGFIKKTQRTLASDIDIAETRYKDWHNG